MEEAWGRAMAARVRTKEDFLKHYEETMCDFSLACKKTRISPLAIKKYIRLDTNFRNRIEDLERVEFDFVRGKYMENINNNSSAEILHYMKTKGTKYGYREHKEEPKENNVYERIIILDK